MTEDGLKETMWIQPVAELIIEYKLFLSFFFNKKK